MAKIHTFWQNSGQSCSWRYLCVSIVCLFALPAQAKYGGGKGTAEEPYLINTAQQMNAIGTRPTDWDKHFKLMADIDLSGYTGTAFNIIGNGTTQFRGVFDGDGHTISNFTYNWTGAFTTNIALFGWVDGNDVEIKNLGLIEPNVVMANGIRAGALIGWQNSGTVSNCYVEGGSVSGDSQIGGLMGSNGGTVIDCYATCTVTAYNWAGGLAGINAGGGVITNCSASGPVTANLLVGGLVGMNSNASISNSYAMGGVSGGDYLGGLVGRNSDASISNSYAMGGVSGGDCLGGLAGYNTGGAISKCYSTGPVSCGPVSNGVGGLVGKNTDGGTVDDSFWDVNTSGWDASNGGTGKTTAEMQTESTFTSAGWDFTTPVWTMCYCDSNYPKLWWELRVYYVDAADGNDNNIGLTEGTAFATIQTGIDTALCCEIVSVQPGVYNEDVNFPGKAITVTSSDPTDPNIVNNTIIAGYVQFSGTEGPNCTLTGFRIDEINFGFIIGNGTHAAINSCIISGNSPCCGFKVINNCDGTISNCLIVDNTYVGSPSYVINNCNGLIKNCTIANNNNASGVYFFGGSMTIENCIIYNNDSGSDSQIDIFGGGTLNISYSNIQGGIDGIGGDGTVNWGLGNIDVDPCFVDAENGDYHLLSEGWYWHTGRKVWTWDDYVTSRCIDVGNPGSPLGNELMTVPPDPLNEYGTNLRINMGFFGGTSHASMPPHNWALLADLSNDGVVDYIDLAGQVEDWLISASEQPGDLNRDGTVNMKDFAALAKDWLQITDWAE